MAKKGPQAFNQRKNITANYILHLAAKAMPRFV